MYRSVLIALTATLLLVAALVSEAPARTTSSRCGSSNTRHGYVNNVRASGTGCRAARSVARAYNSCKAAHRRHSSCRRISGYGCREGRRTTGVTQFYANVTCSRRGRRVTFLNSVNR